MVVDILPCPVADVCKSEKQGPQDFTLSCAAGCADRLCSRCEKGYYSVGLQRECFRCDKLQSYFLLAGYVLFLVCLVWYLLDQSFGSKDTPRSATLKILLNHLQCATILLVSNISWADAPLKAFNAIVQIGKATSSPSLDCILQDVFACSRSSDTSSSSYRACQNKYFLFYLVSPVVIVAAATAALLLTFASRYNFATHTRSHAPSHAITRHHTHRGEGVRKMKYNVVLVGLSLALIFYFDIVSVVFQVFSCTLVSGQSRYLSSHPWYECMNRQYSSILAFAICWLLLVIAFAAFVVRYLQSIVVASGVSRNSSNAMTAALIQTNSGDGDDASASIGHLATSESSDKLMILLAMYHPNYRWWEAVLALRKVSIAFAVTVIDFSDSNTINIVVFIILQVSLLLQHYHQPFHAHIDNDMETLSLYISSFSFFVGLVASVSVGGLSVSIQWLLFLLHFLYLAVSLLLIAFDLLDKRGFGVRRLLSPQLVEYIRISETDHQVLQQKKRC